MDDCCFRSQFKSRSPKSCWFEECVNEEKGVTLCVEIVKPAWTVQENASAESFRDNLCLKWQKTDDGAS